MSRINHLTRAILAVGILLGGLIAAQGTAIGQGPTDKDPAIPADKGPKQTTASGLQYSVLVAGKADATAAKTGDLCRVHYTGWHTDGRVFDSSHRRKQPFVFGVGAGVIKGWSEGVQLMKPGASFKFTIPAALAYGAPGKAPVIQPNETLIFQIDLIDVMPFAAKAKGDKKLRSGIKYDVLRTGKGDAPGKENNFEIRHALWNTKGKLLDTSYNNPNALRGKAGKFNIKFLNEAPCVMNPGSIYRFEVPAEFCFGDQAKGPDLPANSTTVWLIEMIKVIQPMPIPEYFESKKENLKTTKSGLQYEVIKAGLGKNGEMGKNVTVHYVGWLPGGDRFDSSYERGEPSTFRLGAVIQGWNEGLALMKEGAVYKFVIPGNLAYGERGSPPKIQPNATLEFLVELIKVGD